MQEHAVIKKMGNPVRPFTEPLIELKANRAKK